MPEKRYTQEEIRAMEAEIISFEKSKSFKEGLFWGIFIGIIIGCVIATWWSIKSFKGAFGLS